MIYAVMSVVSFATFLVIAQELRIRRLEDHHIEMMDRMTTERNQLLNRIMANGNIHEYRAQVVTEATTHAPNEQEVAERIMDQTYGPGWREMG